MENSIQGIVYLITNIVTNKKYVGQTKSHNIIFGTMVPYGIEQRFVDHVYASRRTDLSKMTQIAKAIKEHGYESFTIEELERCSVDVLNERECMLIYEQNTLIPNGYNVQCQSFQVILPNYLRVELRAINKNGVKDSTRIFVDYPNDIRKRIHITGDDFQHSLAKARALIQDLDPSKVFEHHSISCLVDPNSNELWYDYREKIDSLNERVITEIKVCLNPAQNQIRVEIKADDMKSYKDKVRIVFGSKKKNLTDSYKIAMAVVSRLEEIHNITHINDDKIIKAINNCSQQVAAEESD